MWLQIALHASHIKVMKDGLCEPVPLGLSVDAAAEFLPGRYDVALIDLGMPDLPGDQVARKMREADSAMVTVLVTGWELEEGDPRLVPFDLRILKPFGDLVTIQRMVGQAVKLHDSRAGKSAQ